MIDLLPAFAGSDVAALVLALMAAMFWHLLRGSVRGPARLLLVLGWSGVIATVMFGWWPFIVLGSLLALVGAAEVTGRVRAARARRREAARAAAVAEIAARARWVADAEHDDTVTGRAVIPLGWNPDHCDRCRLVAQDNNREEVRQR
ncbi:hypothetical protein ABN028_19810 [Actinopolymorpha sp. B17G11]|uniref:hypothetical protein n=1 Tax=Actinopolymorpha sp. B17G11 TaxID=3160861 RepID=UPI0032E392B8